LVGGLFLCYLGLRTLVARPSEEAAGGGRGGGLIGAYASTFFLTLTNPTTILSFAAIFAAVSVRTGALTVVPLIVGVFLGSASWWLLLSTGASLIRDKVGPRGMRAVNIVSGAAILAFGLAAVGAGILG
ncbi:MAG TPA: LysE family transporter, partial [Rubrobacter sp.]|nr:LysE family transporter [Rubrobacter sp.]